MTAARGLGVRERLEELESEPFDTDIMDVDALLLEVGFTCTIAHGTRLYYHSAWRRRWTFVEGVRAVPVGYLRAVLSVLRHDLTRDGEI